MLCGHREPSAPFKRRRLSTFERHGYGLTFRRTRQPRRRDIFIFDVDLGDALGASA